MALTRSPMRALIRVDFQAFGRPTMATYQTLGISSFYDYCFYIEHFRVLAKKISGLFLTE
jgi:hypothetical protein